MNLNFLTAAKLRIVLSITIGLILVVSIGIFYVAYGQLGKSAIETGDQVASAKESQNTLQRLQVLKKDLESKQAIIDKTNHIVADSQNYTYQDRIISDITTYASRANLKITNITFAASPGAVGTPPAQGAAVPAAGLKTATISVTVANPVNYKDILNFLHYIEQNLTKLKLSKVSLQKSGEGDGVTTDVLSLEVYVR